MKIEKVICLLFIIVLLGCKESEKNEYAEFEEEIKALESDQSKKAYLEKVLEDDQKVRGTKGQEIMMKYGKDSKEEKDYIKAQWEMDDLNLFKVEKYMEIHGYPKKELGESATTAPWMVIHHSRHYDARERNFEKVYEGYLKGDIDDGAISFYLGRMYNMKNNKWIEIESPFKPEDEINLLIKELGLEDKKIKVQKLVNGGISS